MEIIKSFSSSDHYTPLHYTELAVVSVDNFPSELLADFPASDWLRPREPEVRWESSGLSWEAKPRVLRTSGSGDSGLPERDQRDQTRPGLGGNIEEE